MSHGQVILVTFCLQVDIQVCCALYSCLESRDVDTLAIAVLPRYSLEGVGGGSQGMMLSAVFFSRRNVRDAVHDTSIQNASKGWRASIHFIWGKDGPIEAVFGVLQKWFFQIQFFSLLWV